MRLGRGRGRDASALGERLNSLLDITIVYPEGPLGLWGLLSGQVRTVIVEVRQLTVPHEFFVGSYESDPEFRKRFLSSFIEFRRSLLDGSSFGSLVQLGSGAFEEIGGVNLPHAAEADDAAEEAGALLAGQHLDQVLARRQLAGDPLLPEGFEPHWLATNSAGVW